MGFEGERTWDTWVHPLMMGLEEHLLQMFREDFEFTTTRPPPISVTPTARPDSGANTVADTADVAVMERVEADATVVADAPSDAPADGAVVWALDAEKELKKIHSSCAARPAAIQRRSRGSGACHHNVETLYDAKAHFGRDRKAARAVSARVVMITLDSHAAGAVERARRDLTREMPGLVLDFHVASHWDTDPESLASCKADIARADVIFVSMLFMEPHVQAILPDLEARRACDALVGCVSAGEIIKLTRMGGFAMANADKGPMALLKRLRGSPNGGRARAPARWRAPSPAPYSEVRAGLAQDLGPTS